MIVARGLGIGSRTVLATAGWGIDVSDLVPPEPPVVGGGAGGIPMRMPSRRRPVGWRDDRDMIEIMPIIVGVLNARH